MAIDALIPIVDGDLLFQAQFFDIIPDTPSVQYLSLTLKHIKRKVDIKKYLLGRERLPLIVRVGLCCLAVERANRPNGDGGPTMTPTGKIAKQRCMTRPDVATGRTAAPRP